MDICGSTVCNGKEKNHLTGHQVQTIYRMAKIDELRHIPMWISLKSIMLNNNKKARE